MNIYSTNICNVLFIIMFCLSGISSQRAFTASGEEATGNTHSKSVGSINVGDMYGGGVVAWVNKSGTHGLILSAIDLSSEDVWSNIQNEEIGDEAQSMYDGKANSEAIVAQAGHTHSAAKLCLDYTNVNYGTGVYSDWYLPSIEEMKSFTTNLMDIQFGLINDNDPATTAPSLSNRYWSSTETIYGNAWYYGFDYGITSSFDKSITYRVRAVRVF